MTGRNDWKTAIGVVALFAGIAAAPVWAFGPGGRGQFGPPPGPGGHPGGRPGGFLMQLVFPCQAACGDTARSCSESADSEAIACVSAACAAEITAAQTACDSDKRSDACKEAVNALRTCADSCLDTRQ